MNFHPVKQLFQVTGAEFEPLTLGLQSQRSTSTPSEFLFLCTFVMERNLFQFSYFQSTSELILTHCDKLNGWVGLFVFSFTWESRCKNHKYCFLIATALPMKTKEKKLVHKKLTIAHLIFILRSDLKGTL